MSKIAITGALNVVELPNTIGKVQSSFQYLHYEPEERTSLDGVFLFDKDGNVEEMAPGYPPRFVELKVYSSPNVSLQSDGVLNRSDFIDQLFN